MSTFGRRFGITVQLIVFAVVLYWISIVSFSTSKNGGSNNNRLDRINSFDGVNAHSDTDDRFLKHDDRVRGSPVEMMAYSNSYIGSSYLDTKNKPYLGASARMRFDKTVLSNGRGNQVLVDEKLLHDKVVASKMGNETIKAELGRAAWKVLHTMMAQFPDKPEPQESEALRVYVYLFQRLYPCGECAEHFGRILEKYPPQVATRSDAATWGCFVHNLVNERLGKDIFDCSKIGDFYDCGCSDGDKKKNKKKKEEEEEGKQKEKNKDSHNGG